MSFPGYSLKKIEDAAKIKEYIQTNKEATPSKIIAYAETYLGLGPEKSKNVIDNLFKLEEIKIDKETGIVTLCQ